MPWMGEPATMFAWLASAETIIPTVHWLSVVHEGGVPLKPNVYMSNSSCHLIMEWLTGVGTFKTQHTGHFRFRGNRRKCESCRKQMCSLEVTSLFTNVPISETIDMFCESILKNRDDIGVPVDELRQAHKKSSWKLTDRFMVTKMRKQRDHLWGPIHRRFYGKTRKIP